MFKFIKDEIELITGSTYDKTSLLKLFIIFAMLISMIHVTYTSFIELIHPEISYVFSSDSYCSAPPSAEILLFGMLVCLSILTIMEHYENKE